MFMARTVPLNGLHVEIKTERLFFSKIRNRIETTAMAFETEPVVTSPPIKPRQKSNVTYKTEPMTYCN